MNNNEFIGKQIYNVRVEKGIKQIELANLICKNQATFSNKEAGRYPFTVQELKIICQHLEINIDDLLKQKSVSEYDKQIKK